MNTASRTRTAIYVMVALATFLLMAFLVRQMVRHTTPAPLGADRGLARAKDNAQIHADAAQARESYGFVSKENGVVRVPIDEAVKETIAGYRNPGEFHSNLVTRLERAITPPPKPPEKPGEYE